eukprot:m.95051 g.95051  ORF g.95051 m.95051 type:complete len:649 (+) comp13474_c0_seq1:417-2363(+)
MNPRRASSLDSGGSSLLADLESCDDGGDGQLVDRVRSGSFPIINRRISAMEALGDGSVSPVAELDKESDGSDENVSQPSEPEEKTTPTPEPDARSALVSPADCDITHGADTDWQTWGKWATCVCVVGFDLEVGQRIEKIFPEHARLNAEDAKNISFLSLPDSNTGCTGDSQFNFRIRASDGILPRFTTNVKTKKYLFGSVYFRQVPDAQIRRGYYQKSVVLLASNAYPSFYKHVVSIIARAYFARGFPALQAACMDMCTWPDPNSSTKPLILPMLEKKLTVKVTSSNLGNHMPEELMSSKKTLLASPFAVNLGPILVPFYANIQFLWELMLTAEPVIIRASNPRASSELVLALVSLIAPLKYMGDFRPYFTIHDKDCQTYVKQKKRFPCCILGVTNPYFEQAFQTWPTMLRVDLPDKSRASPMKPQKMASLPGMRLWPATFRIQGVSSTYKQMIENDKSFARDLLKAKVSESSDLTIKIRAHFWSLTQQFLIPFERYFARIMPLKKAVSPFKAVPKFPKFDPKHFLSCLPEIDCPRQVRCRNWIAVYRRFLKSPNFKGWLAEKEEAANNELLRLYLDQVCDVDLSVWLKKKTEVEKVDFFLRVRDAAVKGSQCNNLQKHTIEILNAKMEALLATLPEDLQTSMAFSVT